MVKADRTQEVAGRREGLAALPFGCVPDLAAGKQISIDHLARAFHGYHLRGRRNRWAVKRCGLGNGQVPRVCLWSAPPSRVPTSWPTARTRASASDPMAIGQYDPPSPLTANPREDVARGAVNNPARRPLPGSSKSRSTCESEGTSRMLRTNGAFWTALGHLWSTLGSNHSR